MTQFAFQTYTGNGSTTQYSISWTYIDSTHVKCFLDGVSTTAFSVSGSTVTFNSAPQNNVVIRIERQTPLTARLVDFQDGSVLTEADLDMSANQNFFAVQEFSDDATNYIQLDTDDKYNAQSKVIKSVANPVNDNDVVNKTYLENTWLSSSDKTNLTAVGTKVTELGRLGTADAVADMNTLGTADVVSDMNTLATADVVADMNTLATADVVSDMNTLATADIVSDMNTLATSSNVTNMNTLAGISSNITTLAGFNSANINTLSAFNSANINTLSAFNSTNIDTLSAFNSANINTVASIGSSNITAVAGKSTEIGLLGTASVITDMSILGTADVVSDMNILATADIVSDMNTLATADIVSDMNTLATADNVANMNTCADNITSVNTFANRYRIGSSDPTTSLDEGDLFFNTTSNTLKFYNGSAWADIDTGIQTETDPTAIPFSLALG